MNAWLAKDKSLITVLGAMAVFASAFCFYMSTTVIRWSQARVAIDPAFFVFARFLLGFTLVGAVQLSGRVSLRPKNIHLLVGRAIANTIAVYCFYQAVTLTSVAEANILNMTYPLFIALFSWVFLRDQRDAAAMAAVVVAFAGIWLILSPGRVGVDINNLWGLASGISAAAAIIYLNLGRRHHDTHTILFFMFGIGGTMILVIFWHRLFIPNFVELGYLAACAAFGIGGQYLLTVGFRYVTAVEGAILSSTRILLAAICGPFLVGDPALGLAGWIGACLLFGANAILAVRRHRSNGI
jgi:drug/metabolite transporter (DMT)-like permease